MADRHLKAPGKGQFIYDYKHDILLFKIKGRNYKRSVEFKNFVIDIDDEEFVTGIRFFSACKLLGVERFVLTKIMEGEFSARIEKDAISVTLKFVAKYRNRRIPIFQEKEKCSQRITAPINPKHHLAESYVESAMEA